MNKELSNRDILQLSSPQPSGKIYFVAALESIGDWDIQLAVMSTELELKAVASSLNDRYKEIKLDSEKTDFLNQSSTVKVSTVKLTDSQLRNLKPNYDMARCLSLIVEKSEDILK